MKDRTIFKTILAIAFCIILLIGLYILTNSFNKEYTNENEKIKQENIQYIKFTGIEILFYIH